MRKNTVFRSLVVFFVSLSMLGGGQVVAQDGEPNVYPDITSVTLNCSGLVSFEIGNYEEVDGSAQVHVAVANNDLFYQEAQFVAMVSGQRVYEVEFDPSTWPDGGEMFAAVHPGHTEMPSVFSQLVDCGVGDDNGNGNGDSDNGTPVTVQVILPGGESVEGAEFGLYAPAASALPPGAFHTGIVGPNNTLTLPELIPGTYRIVIAPEDGTLIEFNITLDENDTALVVDLTEDDADDNGDGGSKDSDKAPSNGKNDGADKVTGLPETGVGVAATNGALWMVTAASMVMAAGALLIRQKRG